MTREQMTKNIYHQTSINGRGSGWLAMLIHEVTGTVNALRNCSDEQIKLVYERVYHELPRKPKGRKKQGDKDNG